MYVHIYTIKLTIAVCIYLYRYTYVHIVSDLSNGTAAPGFFLWVAWRLGVLDAAIKAMEAGFTRKTVVSRSYQTVWWQ